jgi:hypothetical protein
VHVDGVPHTARHFLGFWAVGSLIGTTLDVDLVSQESWCCVYSGGHDGTKKSGQDE